MKTITVRMADITTLAVDAVVNSANRSLLGGGGVDRAIHRAAGRELLLACAELNGCPVGSAKITDGFHLPARRIIHAVGPVWLGRNEDIALLAACYRAALDLAAEEHLQSVAFPCISCGIHRFPPDIAARTAVRVMQSHSFDGRIIICCHSETDFAAYRNIALRAQEESQNNQPLDR